MKNTPPKIVFVVGSEPTAYLFANKLNYIDLSITIKDEFDIPTKERKIFSNIDLLLAPIRNQQKPIRIFKEKQRYQKHFKKNKLK